MDGLANITAHFSNCSPFAIPDVFCPWPKTEKKLYMCHPTQKLMIYPLKRKKRKKKKKK
jgi:hypothetical protein